MVTPRIRSDPLFTAYVVRTGVLAANPFVLLDVGASGGIADHWRAFGEYLIADGFEPLVAEAARLNALSSSRHVLYHAVQVTAPDDRITKRVRRPAGTLTMWRRTSAVRAMELLQQDYAKEVYDPSGRGVMSEETTTLDGWHRHQGRGSVDFLKTDTNAHNYSVLRGAVGLLQTCPVLGVDVEVAFHGSTRARGGTFSTIDRFLRQGGFSLFDLEPYRYSRAVLPQPFAFAIPAQTTRGQVVWADALYMRDAGDPDYAQQGGVNLTPHKLLKLACLYEIFGCEDCAAEVLLTHRAALGELFDIEYGLDLLTPARNGKSLRYRHYLEQFETDPTQWYPRNAP